MIASLAAELLYGSVCGPQAPGRPVDEELRGRVTVALQIVAGMEESAWILRKRVRRAHELQPS